MDKVGNQTMKTKVSNYEIKNGATINSIKALLMNAAGAERKATNALGIIIRDPQMQEMWEEKQDRANRIVAAVKAGSFGLPSDIATTVEKFGRCSEKQAYWIARAAWENELPEVFCEEDGMASVYCTQF